MKVPAMTAEVDFACFPHHDAVIGTVGHAATDECIVNLR